jgi:hypothetical protein
LAFLFSELIEKFLLVASNRTQSTVHKLKSSVSYILLGFRDVFKYLIKKPDGNSIGFGSYEALGINSNANVADFIQSAGVISLQLRL